MKHGRFAVLDGLRGIAALVVLSFHLVQQHDLHALPFAGLAVDFFYVLSGFVVALAYEEGLRSGSMGLKTFASVRMKRLYPLVFLGTSFGIILAIIAAVFKHDITFEQIMLAGALGLLLLPSFVFPRWETAYPFNMASWSLTFELFVNAIYGIIAPRLGPRWLLALVAASGGVLVWVAFANHGIGGGNNQKGFAWGFGRVLFPFFAGVALYRHRIKRALHPVVGIAMCVALPLFLLLPGPRSPITSLLFVFVIFPIIVASGAAVNVGGTPNAICRVFGMLSYPVYILQGPVLRVGEEVLKHRPLDLTGEWTFGLAEACVVLLVAWFASRFYDEPLQRLFRGRAPINFRKEAEQPNAA